jgi:hypothetical protein
MGEKVNSTMFRLHKRRLRGTFITCLLFGSLFTIPLFLLIQPTWSQPPWWNENWSFRKQIIIDHTKVIADIPNFPVLLDFIDSDLKAKAQFSGSDITFTVDHNNTLNHEIEFYDGNSGHLVAWIQIPLLSSTADTELFMYYGNPYATNQQNVSAVWGSSFVMVQHLEESGTSSRYDSTIYANNGVTYGGIAKSAAGKIDGADVFDGTNDYLRVSNSPSLNPTSAMTIELWMNITSTGNFVNLVTKGIWSQYYLRLGPTGGRTYFYVKFIDGTVATIESWNIGWKWNTWHHLAVTLDTQAGTIKVYLDGVQKLSSSFAAGKTIISTTNPLLVSDINQNWVKGTIDEIRMSNVARSPAWIQTNYNNQKDPSAFYTIVGEEAHSLALLVFESPKNEATGVYANPALSVRAVDPNGMNMTITFKQRILNMWTVLETFQNVSSGTYTVIPTQMQNLSTTYYWGVEVTDGQSWTNRTFSFTTTSKILQQKWITNTPLYGISGVLAADINKDGIDEVIYAGKGGVTALKGSDGSKIWNVSDSSLGDHGQPQMADLNNDGIMEIVVLLESPAGLLVLRANNGSTYWRLQSGLGRETYGGPVIFDIDGTGYPYIFMGSTDTTKGLNGTGRLTSLSYDGKILRQTFIWRPCSGGLSIADTDGDGEFELYMGDRYMYLNDPVWGDNDYGKGVQSFWARNLTLRWSRPDIFCSSQKPMIADVNKDGKLDIIIGDLNGGLVVLNSTDGSTIRMSLDIPNNAPVHYQPSIYDIDADGNLEMLMADPHNTTSDDLVVWDLVKWQVDARIYIGKCFYGPQVADVNGDGQMEIIACNYKSIFIIDKTYRVLDGIVGLSGNITQGGEPRNIDGISILAGTLNYAVVQDIDGDGYNELVVSTQSGSIYAFDTPARRPNPRPRTEVQFYSEYRLGAAEYVQPQGGPAPNILSNYPQNSATDMPLSLSTLNFTLVDYQHDPMNYTVTTTPNIGSDSKINVANGRYSLLINNLSPSTTYTWTVTATDGTHTRNATYTFTTKSVSQWWKSDWTYRKAITIDHTKVSGNPSNIPVLIDITDSNLASRAQPDGDDIAFTDANAVKLNHEIELYNSTNGHIIAWVNVLQLSPTTDTTIFMYYGNSLAPSQQNSSAVWASSFVMVQHLEESGTSSRYDSTIYANNGVTYGGIAKSAAGKIDGADVFDGTNDYIRVGNSPSLNPTSAITIELWMKLSSTVDFINLVNKGTWGQYYLRLGSTEGRTYWYVKFSDSTGASIESGNIGWKWNMWHHLAVTLDTQAGTIKVYLDGVQKLSGTFPIGKTIISTTSPFLISDISQRWVKGEIDEVRMSNVARSPAWIQTSYNNQKDPSTFYTVGSEETIPRMPMVLAPSPVDKAANVPRSLSELSFNLTDPQGDPMNFVASTSPDIGSGSGTAVSNGRYTIPVSNLQYSTTYRWHVNVTDGTYWTNMTYTFTTLPSEQPTQDDPILTINGGNLVCYNQSTYDPDDSKVTNTYHWYRNGTSTTNLQLPFNTNSSTTAKDYSGYNNNGIVVRGAQWTSSGKVGGAYQFNKGLIQVPGTNSLDGGGSWPELTVEHWIYLTASQSNTRTIARIPSYEIGISGNKLFASIWVATGSPMISGLKKISSNTTLQLNTWYHVVLTYKSGVALTLYINGVQDASKTLITGNIQPSGSNPLYIGWFDYFKGMIDEVAIYPKSLSTQQVYQRFLDSKDGLSSSSANAAQETKTGETWRCEVTPNDSHQDGATKTSNTITIGINNPPTAKNLAITPTSPKTNDNLTAGYTYFDPEGNAESGTETRWYKNGILQPLLNDTLTVSASLTEEGETWYFTVKPRDGTTFGDLKTSPTATIQNTPP